MATIFLRNFTSRLLTIEQANENLESIESRNNDTVFPHNSFFKQVSRRMSSSKIILLLVGFYLENFFWRKTLSKFTTPLLQGNFF